MLSIKCDGDLTEQYGAEEGAECTATMTRLVILPKNHPGFKGLRHFSPGDAYMITQLDKQTYAVWHVYDAIV